MKSPNIKQRAKRKTSRNSRNSSHGTPLSFLKIHQGYVLDLQEENTHTDPRKLFLRFVGGELKKASYNHMYNFLRFQKSDTQRMRVKV